MARKRNRDTQNDDHADIDEEMVEQIMFPFMFFGGGGECGGGGNNSNKEFREKVKNLPLEPNLIDLLLKKLDKELDDKMYNWFNNLLKIPFGKFSSNRASEPVKKKRKLPSKENNVESIDMESFFNDAIKLLDENIYGLEVVKEEIISYSAGIKSGGKHPKILGLYGNAGIGKTEITRNGIARALNRKISCISCGGMKDSSYLVGFDYTYQGSRYGKFVESFITAGEMDPVIFIDELDKISDTNEGREIENTLIHILDPSQNHDFRDKYFSEIPIDMSNCIFVVAFNDKHRISPILLDRMNIIKVPDPSVDAKLNIFQKHLLPRAMKLYSKNFKPDDIKFTDDIVKYIVKNFTNESGVRNLNRCLETILSRLNVIKMLGKSVDKFKFSFLLNLSFPVVITENIVDKLLKKEEEKSQLWKNLYM